VAGEASDNEDEVKVAPGHPQKTLPCASGVSRKIYIDEVMEKMQRRRNKLVLVNSLAPICS